MAISYTIFPIVAAIIGAMIATFRQPGAVLTSAIQHFAAGVVFAAAAGEILPDILHQGSPIATLVGGAVGVAAMLGLRQFGTIVSGPTGLLATIGIDVFIDGLVLGIGFSASTQTGLLLTIALTLEVLFLGVTAATALSKTIASKLLVILATGALMLLLPFGTVLAAPVAALSEPVRIGMFAFGLIALLYLVTEELLVEAHETPDRPWVTALFFVGFLILLLLEEMIG